MTIIEFQNFRRAGQNYLGTVDQGEEDFPLLEKMVKEIPNGSTILLDISGFEFFGYSYSKQTVRKILHHAKNGYYGKRYFLIYAKNEKYCDELAVALREAKLAMIVSSSKSSNTFYQKYFLIGELSEPHRATLEYIIRKGTVTSGQVKHDLKMESYQGASNRIKALARERLVRWEESPNRLRNVFDCKRIDL